jgi:NAD(P)-dependent dehydrogenase (short-subunit alcohol dehydrogenase family)
MQNAYTNKIVLVAGGTSGIGRSTALAFAEAGAKVAITGRRGKEGTDVAAEITKTGAAAAFVRTDVAKEDDVVRAIDYVLSTHGRLDVAFNNAGVEMVGPLDTVTEEQYRRTFDINVWGVLNSMKHEVAAMLKNGGGAIVNDLHRHGPASDAGVLSSMKHEIAAMPKNGGGTVVKVSDFFGHMRMAEGSIYTEISNDHV